MNIDDLRQRLLSQLDEMIDGRMQNLMRVRYRPAYADKDGKVMPGNSAEEMALLVAEINSEIRTLHGTRVMINDTINKMMAPTQAASHDKQEVREF